MSWSPSTELRGVAFAIAVALFMPVALAQDAHDHHPPAKSAPADGMSGGCQSFKWPLDKERAAFDAPSLEKAASGVARGPLSEQAFALALVPVADVVYALAPTKNKSDGYGGIIEFGAPERPGAYQVTLSGEGWIDLVQDSAALELDRPFRRQKLSRPAQKRALQGRRGAGNAADQRLANQQHQDCDQAGGLGLSQR